MKVRPWRWRLRQPAGDALRLDRLDHPRRDPVAVAPDRAVVRRRPLRPRNRDAELAGALLHRVSQVRRHARRTLDAQQLDEVERRDLAVLLELAEEEEHPLKDTVPEVVRVQELLAG